LAQLSAQQLDEIFDQLDSGVSLRAVQKSCELPPPEGFGLRVHLHTLSCFFKAERRRRNAEELAESKLNDLADADPEKLLENVKVELAHACYSLANNNDTATVNSLSRITHRLDRIKLDQQRVTVEQQRLALERDFLAEKIRQFNFEAAKQAAIHALEIKETLQRTDIDLEEKVWKVSDIVFGPKPAGAPAVPQ